MKTKWILVISCSLAVLFASCIHVPEQTTLANQITVTVTGKVGKPGELRIGEDADLASVLTAAEIIKVPKTFHPSYYPYFIVTITRQSKDAFPQVWSIPEEKVRSEEWKSFRIKDGDQINVQRVVL